MFFYPAVPYGVKLQRGFLYAPGVRAPTADSPGVEAWNSMKYAGVAFVLYIIFIHVYIYICISLSLSVNLGLGEGRRSSPNFLAPTVTLSPGFATALHRVVGREPLTQRVHIPLAAQKAPRDQLFRMLESLRT